MKKILLVILIIFNIYVNFAQDSSLIKYLPLKTGNTWVYFGEGFTPITCGIYKWYDRYKLTGITNINGKNYFVLSRSTFYVQSNCRGDIRLFQNILPIRVDSATLNIYKSTNCGSGAELLVDSLKCNLRDSFSTCNQMGNRAFCSDTSSFNIFNILKPSKAFDIVGFEWYNSERYVKGIGLVSFSYYQGAGYNIYLRGAVIDGVLYGDTSIIVGIKQLSTEIPSEFNLEQNYPNPFNPSTKIRFSIPFSVSNGGLLTKIIIYDIVGREIKTIVNGKLSPGIYEADFDASELSSGMYFYRLVVSDASAPLGIRFTDTKKMVLMK